MQPDWSGFYGLSYRLILENIGYSDLPSAVWDKLVANQQNNPKGEGHWEFLALGYLLVFDRTSELTESVYERLDFLTSKFCQNHSTANWRLMARIVRRRLDGEFLTVADLKEIKLIQTKNGFLQDIPGDQSSQYHAFLLFLIMRFACPGDAFMLSWVKRAFEWMVACHNAYGDPSPLGRGRFQLFGYAAMAAAASLANRWHVTFDSKWHTTVWSRLFAVERLFGAVSPCWDGPHRSFLLHGYNTSDDYPAFVALITHGLQSPENPALLTNSNAQWWHSLDETGSGLLADASGVRLAVIAMPSHAPLKSRRTLIRKLFSPSEECPSPIQLHSREILPINNLDFEVKNNKTYISWNLNKVGKLYADLLFWSRTPLQHSVSSGVDVATLTWAQSDRNSWFGLNLRVVRSGTFCFSSK